MTFLERLYPGDAFAGIALNVILQAAIVSLLAVLIGRIVARPNAALRHCILLSALIWVAASPFAAWRLSRAGLITLHFPPASRNSLAPRTVESAQIATRTEITRSIVFKSSAPPSVSQRSTPIPAAAPTSVTPHEVAHQIDKLHAFIGAALLVWVGMTCILLVRLLRAALAVFQIRRHARPANPDLIAPVRQQVRHALGVEALPSILISTGITGPATIGLWHKAVLLPAGLLADLSEDHLRDVLIHECVHALRHDYAVGILQRLVAAAFWFHPMIHLLNRDLRRAREEVCDNAVLQGRSPAAYSRTLLDLCQRIQSAPAPAPALLPGFFDHAWPLERRVAGILNQRRIVMTRIRNRSRLAIGVVVALVGLTLSAVKPSSAQSARDDQKDSSATPATPATTARTLSEGAPEPAYLDHRADFLSPDEELVRSTLDQAKRSVRKAELATKEAQIKKDSAQVDLSMKEDGLTHHVVSASEVDQARLSVELAKVELDRTRVELDEAIAAAVPTRYFHLTIRDGQHVESERYTVHDPFTSVKTLITSHFARALDGGWEISLLRKSNNRLVLIFSGLGMAGREDQALQADDTVIIRRDIVRVLSGPAFDSPVVWQTKLNGRKMTLPEMLKEAGVTYGPNDRDQRVLLQGTRMGTLTSEKSWVESMSNIAHGVGKNEQIDPSDTIVLHYPG